MRLKPLEELGRLVAFQSTHPRGVRRRPRLLRGQGSRHFNPRTREGCDKMTDFRPMTLKHFNPRTREGCDAHRVEPFQGTSDFNPRTREGCDFRRAVEGGAQRISIHAPARGATPSNQAQ